MGQFYQVFTEALIPMSLKLFPKIAEERTLPCSLYKTILTLIPKPKITLKKENHRPLSLMNTDTNILNKLANPV